MANVYNRNFKAGVAFTIFVFVALNIVDYLYSRWSYETSAIKFSGYGFLWGIPFPWFRNDASGIDQMLNGIIIAAVAFVVGFLSKLIFDKGD